MHSIVAAMIWVIDKKPFQRQGSTFQVAIYSKSRAELYALRCLHH